PHARLAPTRTGRLVVPLLVGQTRYSYAPPHAKRMARVLQSQRLNYRLREMKFRKSDSNEIHNRSVSSATSLAQPAKDVVRLGADLACLGASRLFGFYSKWLHMPHSSMTPPCSVRR